MTDAELIQLLKIKLQETLDENDRLKALVANLTEGANAHQTLQSLYRNVELPESLRAKCAIGALPHETPRLEPVPPPLDLAAEPPPIPLAELVAKRRAHVARLTAEARDIEVLRDGTVRVLPKPGSNGSGNGDDFG